MSYCKFYCYFVNVVITLWQYNQKVFYIVNFSNFFQIIFICALAIHVKSKIISYCTVCINLYLYPISKLKFYNMTTSKNFTSIPKTKHLKQPLYSKTHKNITIKKDPWMKNLHGIYIYTYTHTPCEYWHTNSRRSFPWHLYVHR